MDEKKELAIDAATDYLLKRYKRECGSSFRSIVKRALVRVSEDGRDRCISINAGSSTRIDCFICASKTFLPYMLPETHCHKTGRIDHFRLVEQPPGAPYCLKLEEQEVGSAVVARILKSSTLSCVTENVNIKSGSSVKA
jgi:hypothetical protein